MGNIELCLLGVKGSPKRISYNVKQFVESPRRDHSTKPACVRWRIVELMGDLPRIELFARDNPEGWDVWGDEVNDTNTNFEHSNTKQVQVPNLLDL